jgi:hypothetical protein
VNDRLMGSLTRDVGERWVRSTESLIWHVTGLTVAVAGNGIAI